MWTNAPVKDQADLEKKGFVRNFGYAGPHSDHLPQYDGPE